MQPLGYRHCLTPSSTLATRGPTARVDPSAARGKGRGEACSPSAKTPRISEPWGLKGGPLELPQSNPPPPQSSSLGRCPRGFGSLQRSLSHPLSGRLCQGSATLTAQHSILLFSRNSLGSSLCLVPLVQHTNRARPPPQRPPPFRYPSAPSSGRENTNSGHENTNSGREHSTPARCGSRMGRQLASNDLQSEGCISRAHREQLPHLITATRSQISKQEEAESSDDPMEKGGGEGVIKPFPALLWFYFGPYLLVWDPEQPSHSVEPLAPT